MSVGLLVSVAVVSAALLFATYRRPRLWATLVWSGVAALAATAAVLAALELPVRDESRMASMLVPIFWVVFLLHCSGCSSARWVLGSLGAITLASCAVVALWGGPVP